MARNSKTKRQAHSQTRVNPNRTHGMGIWQSKRKVVGIRVDEKLYEAFKPVSKRVFGSVCRPIEAFRAAVIAIAESGVNFGKTIDIKEIRIERNLRPRRGLEQFGFLVSPNPEAEFGVCLKCGKSNLVLYRVKFISDLVADVCAKCLDDYRRRTLVKAVFGKVEETVAIE